jgi:hypothetical protein
MPTPRVCWEIYLKEYPFSLSMVLVSSSKEMMGCMQVAFPGQKKRVEVLIFCLNDTISHLDENLKLTPATISDTTTPPEEASEKHERVREALQSTTCFCLVQ